VSKSGGITISEKITVAAPAARVWSVVSDPYAVAECVPGAVIEGRREDGSYDASMVLQFGPLKVALRANAAIALDRDAMTGTIRTRGKDAQGGLRVGAVTRFAVVPGEETSDILVDADIELTGKLASVVGAGAAIVAKKLSGVFTQQLASRLGAAVTS
jgi:carbon monoxide dehydrogenase subunit G